MFECAASLLPFYLLSSSRRRQKCRFIANSLTPETHAQIFDTKIPISTNPIFIYKYNKEHFFIYCIFKKKIVLSLRNFFKIKNKQGQVNPQGFPIGFLPLIDKKKIDSG